MARSYSSFLLFSAVYRTFFVHWSRVSRAQPRFIDRWLLWPVSMFLDCWHRVHPRWVSRSPRGCHVESLVLALFDPPRYPEQLTFNYRQFTNYLECFLILSSSAQILPFRSYCSEHCTNFISSDVSCSLYSTCSAKLLVASEGSF